MAVTGLLSYIFWLVTMARQESRFWVEPSGLRLAYTEEQYQIALVWTSLLPQWGSGVRVKANDCSSASELWTFYEAQWTWSFIRYSRTWEVVYKVLIPDITPECRYQYQAGAGFIWTSMRTISYLVTPYDYNSTSTADLAHVDDFLVVGDMGSGRSSQATRSNLERIVQSEKVDALLHLGDIAYDLESIRPAISRAFFQEIEPFTSLIPYMVLPGNHEIIDDYAQYKADFRMPVNPSNEGNNLYYSFNLGRVHFTVICGEDLYHSTPAIQAKQLGWIKDDLAMANQHRAQTPWLIIMTHRPYYCLLNYRLSIDPKLADVCNKDCGFRADRLRKMLEEIFYENGVDLVLHAHIHAYQRTTPLYHNLTVPSAFDDFNTHLDPNAPVFILCGAAGNREGNDYLSPTPQLWNLVQFRDLSYGRLKVFNETHLYWELWDSLRTVKIDHVWIIKTKLRYGLQPS